MKKNFYFLAFLLGLTAALSGTAVLNQAGLRLLSGSVTQAQAVAAPASGASYTID